MASLRLLGWSGYAALEDIFAEFETDTGISVSFVGVRNQDDMFVHAQNNAFDVACPTTDRLRSWSSAELIRPFDEERINFAGIGSSFRAPTNTRWLEMNEWGRHVCGVVPESLITKLRHH